MLDDDKYIGDIFNAFRDEYGCSSGDDIYWYITSETQYHVFNDILKTIKDKYPECSLDYITGPYLKSQFILDTLVNKWRDLYGSF